MAVRILLLYFINDGAQKDRITDSRRFEQYNPQRTVSFERLRLSASVEVAKYK